MAKLNGPLDLNGPLSSVSIYKRKDIDKPIVRTKWGPSKERINTDPAFDRTKRNGTEWDGCTKGAKWIRRVLHPMEPVRDFNWAGALSGLLKPIQKLDVDSPYGQRSVLLSQFPHLLEGFSLSRKTPFDSLVRTPFACHLDKATQTALVRIPQLLTGVNFTPGTAHPYFRVIASLGVVPDLHSTLHGYKPRDTPGRYLPVATYTEWLGVKGGMPKTELELILPSPIEFASYSLVLAVALSFGSQNASGEIIPSVYSGSGRIMVVA